MTNQQHPITPPHDKVYWWWEEACKRPSSFYEKLDYVAEQAAQWGWQQRDAGVPGELQQARDEELEACCEWLDFYAAAAEARDLRAARRPKPKNLAEEALDAWDRLRNETWCQEIDFDLDQVRRALERLQELEGQGDG